MKKICVILWNDLLCQIFFPFNLIYTRNFTCKMIICISFWSSMIFAIVEFVSEKICQNVASCSYFVFVFFFLKMEMKLIWKKKQILCIQTRSSTRVKVKKGWVILDVNQVIGQKEAERRERKEGRQIWMSRLNCMDCLDCLNMHVFSISNRCTSHFPLRTAIFTLIFYSHKPRPALKMYALSDCFFKSNVQIKIMINHSIKSSASNLHTARGKLTSEYRLVALGNGQETR